MARTLITGSEGCLGTALKSELRRRGRTVYGCDLQHSADTFVLRGDITEYRQLESVFDTVKPTLVYALAGEFGRANSVQFPEQMWRTNNLGTHNVIELCLKHDARLVFASSSEAYGDLADHHSQLPESALEGRMPNFHNEYALSKLVGERQIDIAQRQRGLKAIVLRFFNCYGRERFSPYRSVVCQFIFRLLHNQPITVTRDGHRDFLYIDDWANTVANVADRFDTLPEHFYNVGDDNHASIPTLAKLIFDACGYSSDVDWRRLVQFRDTEAHNIAAKRPSVVLARRDLGHHPTMSLEEGIRLTVEWMRKEYDIPVVEKAIAAVASA